jgi:hypothetical protein
MSTSTRLAHCESTGVISTSMPSSSCVWYFVRFLRFREVSTDTSIVPLQPIGGMKSKAARPPRARINSTAAGENSISIGTVYRASQQAQEGDSHD